jgi:hypothetical protein
MNYFCQLFNVQRVGCTRQIGIQTFLPEPSISEVEFAIGKLKRFKLPGADQIPAELIQAGGGRYYILKSIWSKKELPRQSSIPFTSLRSIRLQQSSANAHYSELLLYFTACFTGFLCHCSFPSHHWPSSPPLSFRA